MIIPGSKKNFCCLCSPAARGHGNVGSRHGPNTYRGRGRGRGTGRGRGSLAAEMSVEDLDADLENYHAEAMQTN
jgi:THO complex subunit 4